MSTSVLSVPAVRAAGLSQTDQRRTVLFKNAISDGKQSYDVQIDIYVGQGDKSAAKVVKECQGDWSQLKAVAGESFPQRKKPNDFQIEKASAQAIAQKTAMTVHDAFVQKLVAAPRSKKVSVSTTARQTAASTARVSSKVTTAATRPLSKAASQPAKSSFYFTEKSRCKANTLEENLEAIRAELDPLPVFDEKMKDSLQRLCSNPESEEDAEMRRILEAWFLSIYLYFKEEQGRPGDDDSLLRGVAIYYLHLVLEEPLTGHNFDKLLEHIRSS